MRLTETAATHIRDILARAETSRSRGCASASRTAAAPACPTRWNTPRRPTPLDEVVEDKGVKLLIDPKAVLFLLGTEMDFKVDKLSSGFVFNNPNQTSACGCGERVAITPASENAYAASSVGRPWTPNSSANCLRSSVRSTCAACSAAPASAPTASPSASSSDGVIYLKVDDASIPAFEREGSQPFAYHACEKAASEAGQHVVLASARAALRRSRRTGEMGGARVRDRRSKRRRRRARRRARANRRRARRRAPSRPRKRKHRATSDRASTSIIPALQACPAFLPLGRRQQLIDLRDHRCRGVGLFSCAGRSRTDRRPSLPRAQDCRPGRTSTRAGSCAPNSTIRNRRARPASRRW